MTEPAGHQPDPSPCGATEDRDGTALVCTRPSHRGGPHKMIKLADAPAWLNAALDARTDTTLAAVDTTQPLSQRAPVPSIGAKILGPAAVEVPAAAREITKAKSTDGRSPTDIAYGDLIKNVTHAENQRFEGQTEIELYSLLDETRRLLDQARAQGNARQLVAPDIIRALPDLARRFGTQVESWTIQRGLTSDKDGGS